MEIIYKKEKKKHQRNMHINHRYWHCSRNQGSTTEFQPRKWKERKMINDDHIPIKNNLHNFNPTPRHSRAKINFNMTQTDNSQLLSSSQNHMHMQC